MDRKLPALTAESRAFWQGGAKGQLLILFCDDCARFFHPPAPICPACMGENIAPTSVAGTGQVISFSVNHQQWRPDLDEPYIVAIVELSEQEGLRLLTNIVDCNPEDIHIGLPVKVRFLQQEDVWIPLFEVME